MKEDTGLNFYFDREQLGRIGPVFVSIHGPHFQTNRGVKVWPQGLPETFCTDHWRCRFVGVDEYDAARAVKHGDILDLLRQMESVGIDFIKTENLCTFDSEAGYALGQGQ